MIKENNGFKVEAQEEKGCRFALKVHVKADEAKKLHKQAIKNVNKEISIPGFRKGKAPEEAVLKQYAPHIEREWKDLLVNEGFAAALELTQVYPYNRKTIEKARFESASLEEGATVFLAYERYPQIPDVDFASLKLPEIERKAVEEKEIETVLLEVQKAQGTFEEALERAVQLGDFVDISIEKIDEEPPRSLVKERRFEVSESMLPWLKAMIIGLKTGESAEGETAPDPQAPPQENYQPFKVRAHIHAIKTIVLPPIDDALAKKAGADSREDLVAKIRKNLETDTELMQRDEKIRALEALLISHYPFEIPTSLLEAEVSDRLNERTQKMREEGVPEAKIIEEEPALRAHLQKEASNAIRLHFLFSHIGEKDKVTLSKQELNERLNGEMMNNPYYFTVQKQDSELFAKLVNRLNTRFLFEKIREHALSLTESHQLKKA